MLLSRPVNLRAASTRPTRVGRRPAVAGFFDNFGKSTDAARDRELEVQKALLAARRSKKPDLSVEKRRKEVAAYMKLSKEQQRAVRAARPENQGDVYEPEPNWLTSIILPVAPFGDPKMDNGERWDLKAKYTDEGYEDEDSDVMAKLARFFGGKKDK